MSKQEAELEAVHVEEKRPDTPEVVEEEIDRAAERRLLLKLDVVILPLTVLMRGNIGNARLQGLQSELLGGSDTKYSVVLLSFYVTYVLCSIPGTLLAKQFPPNYTLGGACILWAVAATAMAGTTNYAGIIVCRLFIGIGEACFGQAVVLYYSTWYKKNEIAKRLAMFIGAGVLGGAFGGLIAYGVSHIHSGIQTWRVLFLVEGLPSVALGICVVLFLPSRPDTSHYLNEAERELEMKRLRSQNLDEGDHGIDWNGVKRAVFDWKSYALTFIFSCMQLTLASLGGFFPTIIKSLGYTLYTVPPYAVGLVIMMITNSASDYQRIRGPYVMGVFAAASVGWIILLVVDDLRARYFACFCIILGGYCTIPLIQSWVSNNTGSQSQRAICLGYLNSIGNWAAFVAPFIFPTPDAPHWHLGFGMNLAFSCAAIVASGLMSLWFLFENRRRDRVEGRPLPGQVVEVAAMHDLAPGFRYTL